MSKSIIAKIVTTILRIMFIFGIIVQFFIPKIYDLFTNINFNEQGLGYKLAFYMCGIICIVIVFELIKIFDDIYNGSAFKKKVEISLKIIATLFMLLAIIVFVKTIFITTILSIAISIGSFIVSLCFYVLSQVFKVALEYKEEVDGTI